MTQWTTFCRRTNDPKLRYIERRLDDLGILHQRNGESFHAPILEVPEDRLDEAWAILSETVGLDDSVVAILDELDDDHPFFHYTENNEEEST
jgi:hypothetical protein